MSVSFSNLELAGVSTGFDEAYRAGISGAVALDRRHRATVEVTGKDREPFLQNMSSGDVKTLSFGRGRLAAFLTNKGKLVADFIVLRDEERLYLDVEVERAAPLIAALDRYIISEDVKLTHRSEERKFSIEGPEAAARLESVLKRGPSLADLPHLGFVWRSRGEDRVRIVAHGRDPSPRYDVAAPSELEGPLLEELLRGGVLAGSEAVRETRRIEAGRARFGVDMTEDHMPLEAGLEAAVSFDKGCYIGQEYVVRLAHRGHLNRKLVGLELESSEPPARGTGVASTEAEARDIGHVTSAAYSPTLGKAVVLAWLKRDFFEPGTKVLVSGAQALVTPLPFLPPAVP